MSKDVDWNMHEIDLKEFHLSQLPDRPICPFLVKLVFQVPRLTIIPPTFFELMPLLEILDLSNTNILSLPPSISSLSLLQEFFLRDCPTLMELPTQIGMLTKLKLLDIKGTEIMCIPEETGNLIDLEVLRVSLSQYANDYLKAKSVDEIVIPRKMISKLKKLTELCISVCPEAEWWGKELEAIQCDLCDLANLKTLQWYLPTKEVLHQFLLLERNQIPLYASLSNLMVTIGQHAQLTSCLPRDFEIFFGEFKNILKWINAEGNLDDISKIMASTEALFLSRHWTIRNLSAFNITKMKYCLIAECNEMVTLVEANELLEDVETGKKNGEKVGLEMLQYLSIYFMKKLNSLFNGPIGKDSLSKLTILALHACPELTSIFTRSIAQNLSCLIELTVEDCPKVGCLIINDSSNISSPLFHSLERIFLLDLPELVSIFGGLIILEKLDSLLIYNCLKLRYLSTVELPHIQKIQGEGKWWNIVDYDKSKWKNIFEPLKEKRDLVQQLFEATNSLQHFHDIVSLENDEKKSSDSTDIRGELMQDDTMEIGNEIIPLPEEVKDNKLFKCSDSRAPDTKTGASYFPNEEEEEEDLSLSLSGALKSLLYGNPEMKEAVAEELHRLSISPKYSMQMIRQGFGNPLMDQLFHQTSSNVLQDKVAATIMHLAKSTMSPNFSKTPFTLLKSDGDIDSLFSFIGSTLSPLVQERLLISFYAMCQSPSASIVKARLRQNSENEKVLLRLCYNPNQKVRANAVKLFCCLTEDGGDKEIIDRMGQQSIDRLVKIIQSSTDEEEIVSAMGVISNLSQSSQLTESLLRADYLPTKIISTWCQYAKQNEFHFLKLTENVVGSLCHFTIPTNHRSQKLVVEAGFIPILVLSLRIGTSLTKRKASISLGQLSNSSVQLSRPVSPLVGIFTCFSSQSKSRCPVHQGICSVETSFCLVEANAVSPLVNLLEDPDFDVREASLDALLTLIDDKILPYGSKVLDNANAMHSIIKLLSTSTSASLHEKVLNALERIFHLVEFKQKYGALAMMPLVDLTQRGNSRTKDLAERILVQLNVLHDQRV